MTVGAADTEDEGTPLDGRWERNGRSPVAAAVIGLIGIGVLYTYAQGLLTVAGMLVMSRDLLTGDDGSFIASLTRMTEAAKQPLRLALFITQYTAMLLPALWLVRRWHSSDVRGYVQAVRAPWSETLLAVLITLLSLPSLRFVNGLLAESLRMPDFLMRINAELFTAYTAEELAWLVLVVCVTPAVCEEVFFRGYVQRTLGRRLGARSIAVVGVVFALFHQQPLGLPVLTVLGVLFGLFYHRSGSLLPGAAAHFTNNLAAVVTSARTADGAEAFPLPLLSGELWTAAVTVPFLITALLYYLHRTRPLTAAPEP